MIICITKTRILKNPRRMANMFNFFINYYFLFDFTHMGSRHLLKSNFFIPIFSPIFMYL